MESREKLRSVFPEADEEPFLAEERALLQRADEIITGIFRRTGFGEIRVDFNEEEALSLAFPASALSLFEDFPRNLISEKAKSLSISLGIRYDSAGRNHFVFWVRKDGIAWSLTLGKEGLSIEPFLSFRDEDLSLRKACAERLWNLGLEKDAKREVDHLKIWLDPNEWRKWRDEIFERKPATIAFSPAQAFFDLVNFVEQSGAVEKTVESRITREIQVIQGGAEEKKRTKEAIAVAFRQLQENLSSRYTLVEEEGKEFVAEISGRPLAPYLPVERTEREAFYWLAGPKIEIGIKSIAIDPEILTEETILFQSESWEYPTDWFLKIVREERNILGTEIFQLETILGEESRELPKKIVLEGEREIGHLSRKEGKSYFRIVVGFELL